MIALIDETTPFVDGHVLYAVVSGIVLIEESKARAIARQVIPSDRTRPFHWSQEGSRARTRMIEALHDMDVVGRAVIVGCGRRRQEAARSVALAETIRQLLDDDCRQLLIESRDVAQNGRDKAMILDILREHPGHGLSYAWPSKKADELLWIADAIGGAVHDLLLGTHEGWYEEVVQATALQPEYRALPHV